MLQKYDIFLHTLQLSWRSTVLSVHHSDTRCTFVLFYSFTLHRCTVQGACLAMAHPCAKSFSARSCRDVVHTLQSFCAPELEKRTVPRLNVNRTATTSATTKEKTVCTLLLHSNTECRAVKCHESSFSLGTQLERIRLHTCTSTLDRLGA